MHQTKSTRVSEFIRRSLSIFGVNIVCFIAGMGLVIALVGANSLSTGKRPLADIVPDSLLSLLPDSDWMKLAKYSVVGDFVVVAADEHPLNAVFYPQSKTERPVVFFLNESIRDGFGTISIYGSNGRHLSITFKDEDGTLDSYVYVTGFEMDALHYVDSDMDGQYDHRMGPWKDYSVYIDEEWREVARHEGKPAVKIDGKMREIEQTNRIWKLKSRSAENGDSGVTEPEL